MLEWVFFFSVFSSELRWARVLYLGCFCWFGSACPDVR